MKKNIFFFIILFSIIPIGYAQNIIDYGVIESYNYSITNPYPDNRQSPPIIRFYLDKEMMVCFSHCGSQGMTGTLMRLTGPNGDVPLSGKYGNTGLAEATVHLCSGSYLLENIVTTERSGWNLDLTIKTSRPISAQPAAYPIALGTFVSDVEELYLSNSTWDYEPQEGEGGAVRYQFNTVCSTDIHITLDMDVRAVFKTLAGVEVARVEEDGTDITLPKGSYLMITDYMNGDDGGLTLALGITLSEPFDIPKGTLLTNFPPLQQPVAPLANNQNYILTRIMQSADNKKYMDVAQFYDGLGRPSHFLEKKVTPGGNSLVTLQEYDLVGRAFKKWLPVPTTNYYIDPSNIVTEAASFYTNDSRPYVLTEYETSSLSRVASQYAPGTLWKDHPVRNDYLVNITSAELRCSDYYMNGNILARRGDFVAGQLYVNKVTDEDGNKSFTFTNKDGQMILTRQINGTVPHDTYYVYDNFGNLCYVLPPMIKDNIQASSLDLYAYQYKYDGWNRCIEKKMPGSKNLIKYVYDKADRLIFQQDANQALRNEWRFILYDALGREVIQGLYTSTARPSLDDVVVKAKRVSNSGFSNTGYAIENFNYTPASLISINYYDDYDYLDLAGNTTHKANLKYGFTDGATSTLYDSQYVNIDIPEATARGLLTGTKTFILGTSQTLLSSYYYDVHGNIVQSRSLNHLNGYEKDFFAYTFSGKMLRHLHVHSASGKSTQKEVYTYVYDTKVNDNPERLLKVTYQLNNASLITLSENVYDELGRINRKKIHNSINGSEYKYNIRNWLSAIENTKFAQHLYYNDGNGTRYCYNGNISSMTWKSGDDNVRGYKFAYDNLNRMQNAIYGEGESITPPTGRNFSENVTGYDYNGNILSLERYGKLNGSTYGKIDDLSMTYQGNQLNNVSDAATDPLYNGAFNFVDGNKSSIQEYKFDANGNLEQDYNKKLTKIQYNLLNLPSALQLTSGHRIDYLYSSDGMKRRVTHKTAIANISVPMGQIKDLTGSQSSQTHITDYCGNVIYENGTLSKILTEEGYVTLSGTTPTYHYYLKDHQGNNRVVINQTGVIEQINHYYPFGGLFEVNTATSGIQSYKYNGKELDRMHGVDWYDYGARMYDGLLGRFMMIDPLAAKYYSISLYVYCSNNPMKFVDPDGRNPILALYRAYKGYKAYRAVRAATVAKQTADAVAVATAATATAAYSYNYILDPEQAAKAQQSLLEGIESIANQDVAASPEYNNQRKRERDEKDKRNQEQANVAKSIDTNVSGTMPNGDPAPKRDPNDGGDKTRVAIGVTTIGAGAAVVESVVEGTQPQETVSQQPSQQPEVKPQESEKNNEWWQQILNLFQ